MRVLELAAEFEAPDEEALYDGVRAVDWQAYLTPRHTLAIRAACRSSHLTHTQYIAQKSKDAIVDQLRDRLGERPSVDTEDPDVSIFVHLVKDRASLYLDLAGEPLHRRGYRVRAGEAPLKETLAAAILRLSGWNREDPLLDPMCGSGTIPIEAALWARDMAPGLMRPRFGFERWASHDGAAARRAHELRESLRARARRDGPAISGSDIDPEAVSLARGFARRAAVDLDIRRADIAALDADRAPRFLVTNPPYGERLPRDGKLLRDMGSAFARLEGRTIAVLAGSREIAHAIPMRPARSLVLFNGAIECRLLVYEVP